jgi:hypothetical protein
MRPYSLGIQPTSLLQLKRVPKPRDWKVNDICEYKLDHTNKAH